MINGIQEVETPIKAEWDRANKTKHADDHGEENFGDAREIRHIFDRSSNCLYETKGTIDTEKEQHPEEDQLPEVRATKPINSAWIGYKDETGRTRLTLGKVVIELQETNHTPDSKTGEETEQRVGD